ncbi:DUF4355 domain-containing protein [Filifactor alocis]|uniref:DUF4355 domain-containing protein n=1 Tax=Filifactor alocis TaxID=143361 RepID=UPI003F9F8C95
MEEKQYGAFPINLQLFAEDGDGDGTTGATDTGEAAQQGDSGKEGDSGSGEVKTYTEEQVTEMKAAWQKEEDEKRQKEIDDAKKEEKRLLKLSDEERKAEEDAKKLKNLEDREKAVARKEQLSDIRDELTKRKLPVDFAEFFIAEDPKKSLEGIQIFEKTFQAAVEEAVKSKIKGTSIKMGNGGSDDIGKSIATEKNSVSKPEFNPWK